jgi:hypothetical protein
MLEYDGVRQNILICCNRRGDIASNVTDRWLCEVSRTRLKSRRKTVKKNPDGWYLTASEIG